MKNFEGIERKRVTFDKCIDKEGAITFSASLKPFFLKQKQNANENSMIIRQSD
jgi:hypothetical protein